MKNSATPVPAPQGLGSDSLAFLQYTRLPEWHNSSLMKPEDEITAEDNRSNPFGGVPRRSRSVNDVIADRYDIVKELGAGGMGVVLRVFDRLIEEDVALKLIRPELARRQELVDRFKREVRLARQITNKRVCRTYDLLRFGDTLAILMAEHCLAAGWVPGQGVLRREILNLYRPVVIEGQLIISKLMQCCRQTLCHIRILRKSIQGLHRI